MNSSSRLLVLAFAALTLLPSPARAELSQIYVDWGAGPFQFLMTEDEAARWAEIREDAEAEAFIRLFWARRDPDPESPDNENRLECERRVAFADQKWTYEEEDGSTVRGALTDRGRVFLLLGPPRRLQAPGSERTTEGTSALGIGGGSPNDRTVTSGAGPGRFGTGASTDRAGGVSEERWIYEGEEKPEFIKGRRLTVVYRSAGRENRKMVLHQPAETLAALQEAQSRLVVHPDLTLADLPDLPVGLTLGSADLGGWGLAALESEDVLGSLRESLASDSGERTGYRFDTGVFQASNGTWILPFQISTGVGNPEPGRVVGELVDASGESVLGFESDQPWQSSTDQKVLQGTVVAPPGAYELRAGVVDPAGGVAWSGSAAVEVPADAEGLWLSDLLLSEDIHPLDQAQGMFEPYRWQGVAIVPRGDRTFAQGQAMWFYAHACGAGLGPSGQPDLKVVASLTGPKRFRGPLQALPAKAGDDCWVVAQALDLLPESFPEGDYELELQIRDAVSGTVAKTGAAPFQVVASR